MNQQLIHMKNFLHCMGCQKAWLGGFFRMQFYSSQSLRSIMDTATIKYNANLQFLGFLQECGVITATLQGAAEAYKSVTSVNWRCSPACPASQADFEDWQKNAATEPWILSAAYLPIYTLINDTNLQNSFKEAMINHFAQSYIKNEILPALSIFTDVNNKLPIFIGDPTCPIPSNTIQGVRWDDNFCGPATTDSYGHHCCESSQNGKYCANIEGYNATQFTKLISIVKQNKMIIESQITNLTNEGNALLKDSIINVEKFTQFANNFVNLAQIMESGIIDANCTWSAPGHVCVYDPHDDKHFCHDQGNHLWCGCNGPYDACDNPVSCPTEPTVNTMEYLQGTNQTITF